VHLQHAAFLGYCSPSRLIQSVFTRPDLTLQLHPPSLSLPTHSLSHASIRSISNRRLLVFDASLGNPFVSLSF